MLLSPCPLKYERLEEVECAMTANSVGGKGRQLLGYKWLPPLTSSSEEVGPRSRFKHAACTVGVYLYVFGGKDHHTPLADIWRYHLVLHTWEEVSLPGTKIPHLQGHTATAYKRQVLLFGGELSDPSSGESPLWIFNTDLHHLWRCWVERDAVVPQGRRDHSAVVYGNKLYVYGGYIDLKGSSSEFWAFNIDEEEWELLPGGGREEVAGCRHGHSSVVHCKAMWVLGGMNNLQPRHDLCRYMFALKKWHHVKCLGSPPPLTGHTAHVHNGLMLIIGGESLGTKVSDVWILSFENCQWQRVSIGGAHSLPPCVKHASILVAPEEDAPSEGSTKDRSLSDPAFGSHLEAPVSVNGRPQTSPAVLGDGNNRTRKTTRSLNRNSSPFRTSAHSINKIHPKAIEMDVFPGTARNSIVTTPSRNKRASPGSIQTLAGSPSNLVSDVLWLDDAQEEFEVTGSSEFLLSPQSDTEAGLVAQNNIEMIEMATLSSPSLSNHEMQTLHDSQLDSTDRNTSDAKSAMKRASPYLLTSNETAALEHRCCCKQRCCDGGNVALSPSQGWARSSRKSHCDNGKAVMAPTEGEVCSFCGMSTSLPQSQSLDLSSASRKLLGVGQSSHSLHSPSEHSPCFCCSQLESASSSRLCMCAQQWESSCCGEKNQGGTMEDPRDCNSSSFHCNHRLPHDAEQCYFCRGSDTASPSPGCMQCSSSLTPSSSPHEALVQDLDPAHLSEGSWVGSKSSLGKSKSLSDVACVPRLPHHQELLLEDLEWIDLHSGTDKVHLINPKNLPGSQEMRRTTVGSVCQAPLHETLKDWPNASGGVFSRELGNEFSGEASLPTLTQNATQLTCQIDSASTGMSDRNLHSSLSGRRCCASNMGIGVLDTPRLEKGDGTRHATCLQNCKSACVCREGCCLLPNQTASPSASLIKREVVCYNTLFEDSLYCCVDSPMASTRSVGARPCPSEQAQPLPSVRLYEKNCAGSRRQISRRNVNSGGQPTQSRSTAKQGCSVSAPTTQPKEAVQRVEVMEVETPFILVVGGQISFSASLHRQPLALWQLNLR